MRAAVDGIPVPDLGEAAFTVPPALADATVAIITTAALHLADSDGFSAGDQSFRMLAHDRGDLVLGHISPNFDRSGFASDLNVVYPRDRLDELVARGTIGSVGPHHLSFLGAQDDTMETIRLDSGPAAARQLRDDGVDVVLLTPV